MSTTEKLGTDEQKLAELGYKQELTPPLERVLQLRDLVLDHLHPRGLLHDLRAGAEERRPDRDLDRVAADLRPDPVRRLVDVRARLGDAHRRRDLLLGVEAGWRRLGLVHRLVQPDRPGGGVGVGDLRLGDVPDVHARALRSELHLQLRQGRRRHEPPLHRARQLRAVRDHPVLALLGQRVPQPPRVGALQRLGVVEHRRRAGDHRAADRRARPTTRASPTCSATGPTNPASPAAPSPARNSGSTCCRSASC